jgi:hypothetical protein
MAAASRGKLGFWLLVGLIASIGCAKTVLSDTLDPDLFWHLRVAEQLRHEGVGPIVDTLSYNSTRAPWTPYSWLAELFMEWSWRTLGWQSAVAWECACTIAVVTLIALCCLELTGDADDRRLACAVATAVGAVFAIPYLAFRPVTFAIVILGVTAWLLLRDRRCGERSRAVWLVIPLTALCTNVHLAAVVAPIWVGCLLLGAMRERKSARRYAVMLAATAIACLLTPMLPGALRTGVYYLASDVMVARGNIAEIGPVGWPLLIIAGGVFAAVIVNRRRFRLGEWIWLMVTALMMLRMGRFAPMFAFIAAPLLAASLPRMRDEILARRAVVAVLAIALGAATIRIVLGFPHNVPLERWLNRRGPAYPTESAAWVEQNITPRAPVGRLINEFNSGGYLAWRLGPKYQVFVDGRTQVFDEPFWRATYLGADADAARVIETSDADVAIIPRRTSRFRAALVQLGWTTVHSDDAAEVMIPPSRR